MSITEELRAGGKHAPVSDTRWFGEDELAAIADRIDAEHAAKVVRLEAYRAAVDGMLKEYVKLPVDADGVPIHMGDVMTDGENAPEAVRSFLLDERGWYCKGSGSRCVAPTSLRHVKPDSWEGIISDAVILGRQLEWADNSRGDADSERELVERCRRLAGDAE